MESELIREKNLADIITSRYDTLRALYPDHELSLNALAEKLIADQGNLSRSVSKLEDHELLWTRNVPRDKGRPYRLIRLSNSSRKILKSLIDATGIKDPELPPDDDEIFFYINLFENSNDSEVKELVLEEFEVQSRNINMVDDNVFSFIVKGLSSSENIKFKLSLIRSLLNFIRNSLEDRKKEIELKIQEPLLKIALNREDVSDDDTRLRNHAIEVISEISEDEKGYESLLHIFIKLVENHDSFAHNVRNLLISKNPEKRNELKRELVGIFIKSDKETRKIVKEHLLQLR